MPESCKKINFRKMRHLNLLIVLVLTLAFSGCKDKYNEPILPAKDIITETSSVIKAFYPSDQEIVAPYYNPSIKLKYPIGSLFHISIDGEDRMVKIILDTLDTDDKLSYTYYAETDSIAIYNQKAYSISNTPNDIESVTIKYVFRWQIIDVNQWVNAKDENGNPKVETGTLTYKIDKSKIGEDGTYQLVNDDKEFDPFSGFTLRSNYPTGTEITVSPYYKLKIIGISFSLQDEDGNIINLSQKPFGKRILLSHEEQLKSGIEYSLIGNFSWQVFNGKTWLTDSRVKSYAFTFKTKKLTNEFNSFYQYAYPCINQYHFFKDEYPQGYMKLDKIPDLMNNIASTDKLMIRITDIASGDNVEIESLWDSQKQFLSYDISSEFLQNEKIYKLEVIKDDGNTKLTIDELTYYFRTSLYNTFLEKMNEFEVNYVVVYSGSGELEDDLMVFYKNTNPELFDYEECKSTKLNNSDIANGLIQFKLDYSVGGYFTKVKPIYDSLCKYPDYLVWRDPSSNGLPPVYITSIYQTDPKHLTSDDILNGANRIESMSVIIINNLSYYLGRDNYDLYERNIETGIATIPRSYNGVGLSYIYTLPGLNRATSKYNYLLNYDGEY
jgi:hypothetical protein